MKIVLLETDWIIPDPGTGDRIVCQTFKEALRLFEGHNVPRFRINGFIEPFWISLWRMNRCCS